MKIRMPFSMHIVRGRIKYFLQLTYVNDTRTDRSYNESRKERRTKMNDKSATEQIMKQYDKYISRETLGKLIDFNKKVIFQKGKLISADDRGFLLLSGILRGFYLDADGNDVTHMFIFEGSTYGSDFLTTDKPHVCSFEALEECTAVELNRAVLLEQMKSDQGLMMGYIHILEEALKRKILRETSLVIKTATERYLDLKKEYPGIDKRVSQAHIASYLGISPVSLSRIRRVIREENGSNYISEGLEWRI